MRNHFALPHGCKPRALGRGIAEHHVDGGQSLEIIAHVAESCAKCHGAAGKGDTKMGKKLGIRDLTDPQVQAKFTDEQACKAIKEGVKDESGKTTMKAVEGLSDEDVEALVAYVRTLKK